MPNSEYIRAKPKPASRPIVVSERAKFSFDRLDQYIEYRAIEKIERIGDRQHCQRKIAGSPVLGVARLLVEDLAGGCDRINHRGKPYFSRM
jgi:hypothetical protein